MLTEKQKLDFINFNKKRLIGQFDRVVVDTKTKCHTIPGIKAGYIF